MNAHVNKSQGCICPKHLKLIAENARLSEENIRLKKEICRLKKKSALQPFGLSTPSSKQLIKPSAPIASSGEMKRRMGGAKPGHCGHGRKCKNESECKIEEMPELDVCPCCGEKLVEFYGEKEETRDIIDCETKNVFHRKIRRKVHYCPKCKKPIRAKIPGVIPKNTFANGLLAKIITDHYLYGLTIGTICKQTGLKKPGLINAMHSVAEILKPIISHLQEMLRSSYVVHADETTWRTDGKNGYAWLFKAGNIHLFKCEETRGSIIPKSVLCIEERSQDALLMTDRYGGYSFYKNHFFCFEHLKRDVLKILEDNPKSKECKMFVEELVTLLCEAMKFKKTFNGDKIDFMVRAGKLRSEIERVINRKYYHPSILNIQEIFQTNTDHLWGWTRDARIPSENNAAERGIRPLVIARKISHGSQGVKGRETRSVLMSIVHTLAGCGVGIVEKLKDVLDDYALNPQVNIAASYFKDLPLCVSES